MHPFKITLNELISPQIQKVKVSTKALKIVNKTKEKWGEFKELKHLSFFRAVVHTFDPSTRERQVDFL